MLKLSTFILAAAVCMATASIASAQPSPTVRAAVGAAALAQYNDWQPGPGWDRDIDVHCASQGFNYRMCQVDTGRGSRVYLLRQISNTRCIEGRNWGWNRAGVWVDGGCEGVFRVQRRWGGGHGGGEWHPGPGWDTTINVRCASEGFNYRMCQVDTGRGSRVYISRQISNTRCVEGRNWGWNRAGIWVDGGCEAIFTINRRWR